MFKFNFQSESEEDAKETAVKDDDKPTEELKESQKIEITTDQYSEIAEKVKTSHLNCFISR